MVVQCGVNIVDIINLNGLKWYFSANNVNSDLLVYGTLWVLIQGTREDTFPFRPIYKMANS